MEEELLSGLVGIHRALLEHCVNLLVGVFAGDLLDVLDRAPHAGGDRSPSASATHLRSDPRKEEEVEGGRASRRV